MAKESDPTITGVGNQEGWLPYGEEGSPRVHDKRRQNEQDQDMRNWPSHIGFFRSSKQEQRWEIGLNDWIIKGLKWKFKPLL